jgi:phosphinothricin acetyltransferase
MDELMSLATQHGFHAVIARIGEDNEPSINLHRACGFRRVGVEQQVGRKFNRWLDVTVLQRLL